MWRYPSRSACLTISTQTSPRSGQVPTPIRGMRALDSNMVISVESAAQAAAYAELLHAPGLLLRPRLAAQPSVLGHITDLRQITPAGGARGRAAMSLPGPYPPDSAFFCELGTHPTSAGQSANIKDKDNASSHVSA